MRLRDLFVACLAVAALVGCQSTKPVKLLEVQSEAMLYLEPGLQPEKLLFPEFLFLDGFELDQHGRIPKTKLIGADIRAGYSVDSVSKLYKNALAQEGWGITCDQREGASFYLVANKGSESVELRGVQGRGPTQVFLLYREQ